jgi:hypothetical protein
MAESLVRDRAAAATRRRGVRCFLTIATALAFATGCTTETRTKSGETKERDEASSAWSIQKNGISARVPDGWHARTMRLTAVDWPVQRLAVASYPLVQKLPDDGCYPRSALEAMGPDDALVILIEYTSEFADIGSLPRFPLRTRLHLDEGTFAPYECFGDSYLIRFREHGRRFQAHVAFGDRTLTQTRSKALAVLNSLVVEPG